MERSGTTSSATDVRAQHELLLNQHPFGRLPTRLPAAIQILEATASQALSAPPLVDAISGDPVVAARILRLATSVRRGERAVITTLTAAVARLRPQVTALCALDFNLIPGRKEGSDSHAVVWRRSLRTAIVARALARCLDRTLAETLYACGLLTRIGQLIFLEQDKPGYRERLLKTQGDLPPDEERRLQGVRHQELTAAVLRDWGVSSRLWHPILESAERHATRSSSPNAPDHTLRPLTLTTDILIVASRIELLMDGGRREAAMATLCGGRHNARLSDIEAEILLTEIEAETRDMDRTDPPPLNDTGAARLLMRAFERRAEIAIQTGQTVQDMEWRERQLQAQCTRLMKPGPGPSRIADSVRYVAKVGGLSMALLASTGVVILLVMLLFKSALGIDLFKGLHLDDLFD